MKRSDKLRITIDQPSGVTVKGISPFERGHAVARKIVDVSASKVRRELRGVLATLSDLLDDATVVAKDYELKEVSFTLGLEASGQISLLSIASGNVGASSGLRFTFVRRNAA